MSKPSYFEITRIDSGKRSFRLLMLGDPNAVCDIGFRVMNYAKEGNDYRDGKLDIPVSVARQLARAILAETDGMAE